MQSNSNLIRVYKKREDPLRIDPKRDKHSSKERYRKARKKKLGDKYEHNADQGG